MRVFQHVAGVFEEDTITEVSPLPYTGEVYDINVEGTHNYIANGIAVHNCIYSFLSTSIENILRFTKDFPKAHVIKLATNYRSTPEILEFSGDILRSAKETISNPLIPHRSSADTRPTVHQYADTDAEAIDIVRRIKAARAAGVPAKEIAILSRISSRSYSVEMELTREN